MKPLNPAASTASMASMAPAQSAHRTVMFRTLLVGIALAGLGACASEEREEPASDTGVDTGADGGTDGGTDGGIDSGLDIDEPGDTPGDAPDSLPEPDNHRPAAVACDRERASDPVMLPEFPVFPMDCTTHEECTEGENGRCTGNTHDGWRCTYDSCFEDSECGSTVCACSGGFRSDANVCLGGNCQVDSDCGAGGWCSPSFSECGLYSGVTGYWCRTAEDTCLNDSDCPGTGDFGGSGYCMFSQTVGHWECSYSQCAG